MDPVGITLGSVALLAPVLRACWAACDVYSKTHEYGHEYRVALGKLKAQRVILEGLMRLKIEDLILEDLNDGQPLMETIAGELAAMRKNFGICQKLIDKLVVRSDVAKSRESSPPTLQAPEIVPFAGGHKRANLKRLLFSKGIKATGGPSIPTSQAQSTSQNLLSDVDQELSGADALVLQAVSQPPILAASAHEESEARIGQRSASLFQRLHWTLVQKKVFDEAIHELKASNDTLRRLIQIEHLVDPGFLLRRTARKSDIHLGSTQVFLERLHKAILSVNDEPKPDNLEVNVRLVEHHESTRALWNDQGINFRPGAGIVQLQAQKPAEGRGSCLLLVDAFLNDKPDSLPTAPPTHEGESISSLKDALAFNVDTRCTDNFKLVGHIPSQAKSEASYVIYQDVSANWTLRSSLAIDLQNKGFQNRKFAAQHISLAALVALPYAQFMGERLTTHHPRPQHFQFYDYADEPELIGGQPIPYVSVGLGSRGPKPLTRNAGRFVPMDDSVNVAAIELGLLLFQIGSWTPMSYLEGHKSLQRMRDEALSSLSEVVKHSGLGFARIVEQCLHMKKENYAATLYEEIILKLQQLDNEVR